MLASGHKRWRGPTNLEKDGMGTAWEEFVKTHAKAVLDSALRVIGNAADAEDVAQEVFLEVFRCGKLKEFIDQPALMRTIAARRALDRMRKQKTTNNLDADPCDIREHEPSDYAIACELDQRLRDALVRLPAREAEVFCLCVLNDNSVAEVAELLNISKNAIAKSMSMARKKLRQFLEMPEGRMSDG